VGVLNAECGGDAAWVEPALRRLAQFGGAAIGLKVSGGDAALIGAAARLGARLGHLIVDPATMEACGPALAAFRAGGGKVGLEIVEWDAAIAALAAGAAATPALADKGWHNPDVSGAAPPLEFIMRRAGDHRTVTQIDYLGDVVLLVFGYTRCADICPLTLGNLGKVLHRLGPSRSKVRVLFVTVDPDRDTLDVLAQYIGAFGPQFVGLRGSPDELARLARRYRIAYSVTKPANGKPYEVTHSAAIYAFDARGAARLLIPSMSSANPDIAGTAADLQRLIKGDAPSGLLSHMVQMLRNMV
ncbi:MAG: SCO family protein, partial [Proteobacteria bacterium]|nr:SCO family protein [Pseudomonadota bacterium]